MRTSLDLNIPGGAHADVQTRTTGSIVGEFATLSQHIKGPLKGPLFVTIVAIDRHPCHMPVERPVADVMTGGAHQDKIVITRSWKPTPAITTDWAVSASPVILMPADQPTAWAF